MPYQTLNHKVIQKFDHVVSKDKIILYISITRVPMAKTLGRMMTLLDRLQHMMSHDPLITWPCEIRSSLTRRGPARKRFSRHRLLVRVVA